MQNGSNEGIGGNRNISKLRRLKRRRKLKIRIATIILGVFLLIYIPSLFVCFFGSSVGTAMIKIGDIEDLVSVNGIIIRDEEVFKSPFRGKYVADKIEGEKVSANSRIATVSKESADSLIKELDSTDLSIIRAQKEKQENKEFFSGDIAKLDEEIENKLKLVVNESNNNNIGRINKLRKEIDVLVQKKALVIEGLSTSDVYLNSLLREKDKIRGKLSESTVEIISSISGVVSYVIDGYEGVLSVANIKTLVPRDMEKLSIKPYINEVNTTIADPQKPFVKVIKGIDSYILCLMSSKDVAGINVDTSINIRINDINKIINGRVYHKSEEQSGKHLVVIEMDKAMEETSSMRLLDIDLIKSSSSGLKVSLKSLKDINLEKNEAKLVLLINNRAKIVDVKIIGKNNEYAIIDNKEVAFANGVSLYDTYLTNPKNVQEGQIIQ